jgi:hypothetical protein
MPKVSTKGKSTSSKEEEEKKVKLEKLIKKRNNKKRQDEEKEEEEEKDEKRELIKNALGLEQNKMVSYFLHKFPSSQHLFEKWSFKDINNDVDQWKEKERWTSFYLVGNNHPKHYQKSYFGRISFFNLEKRFKQHNGEIPNGPPESRKYQGYCNLLFYNVVPNWRNYSTKDFYYKCILKGNWRIRLVLSIQYSLLHGLHFKISKNLFDFSSVFYSPSIVKQLKYFYPSGLPYNMFIENKMPHINDKVNLEQLKKDKKITRKRDKLKEPKKEKNFVF